MLEWIKTIDEGDPETLILHMNVLGQVLNSDEMPFTVVQPLVLILTRDELLDSERTDKVLLIRVHICVSMHITNLNSGL
jgi:hypothetical protein